MTTEDPATAAKIISTCRCLQHELPANSSLEVQYCTFLDDNSLQGSSYGRMYCFAATTDSLENTIRSVSLDDGGWEYSFNERRASLHFLAALHTFTMEDLVYLFIIAGLHENIPARSDRLVRRVYFNPR